MASQPIIHYTYSDIQRLGLAFQQKAGDYAASIKVFGSRAEIQIPRGGNDLVDHSMSAVLGLVYDTHGLIRFAVDNHAVKLWAAAQTMHDTDQAVIQVIYQRLGITPGKLSVDPPVLPTNSERNPELLPDLSTKVNIPAYRAMPRFAEPRLGMYTTMPYERDLVGGDPRGLARLAQQLSDYVKGPGNATFTFLRDSVMSLVKDDTSDSGYHPDHGGWVGPAAYSFRNAFITDAACMNGLHCAMGKVGQILGEFAAELGSAEAGLESALNVRRAWLETYIARRPLPNYLRYFTASRSDGMQHLKINVPAGPGVGAARDNQTRSDLKTMAHGYFDRAEAARATAAGRLTGIGEVLESGIAYYQSHSSNLASADPGTLITAGKYKEATQQDGVMPDLQKLEEILAQCQSQVKTEHTPLRTRIANDLTTLGLRAGDVSTVLDDIKNVSEAKSAIAKGSGLVDFFKDVLPLLAMIGLEAA